EADVMERNLGMGHPQGHTGGAQEARQGDALRDDERRGRADRDVEEDRRSAAQHQALAQARNRGQGLRGAQARGVRSNADHPFGVLLRRVAGCAQSIFGHGDRGALRQARGHTEGAGRPRRENPPRRDRQLTTLVFVLSTPWAGSRSVRGLVCCGGLDGSILRMNGKTRFMLALITPAALVLVLFQVVPILTGANASFRDWTLHDPKRTWVGLANYIHVLRDQEFLGIVLPNTFGFMFASV